MTATSRPAPVHHPNAQAGMRPHGLGAVCSAIVAVAVLAMVLTHHAAGQRALRHVAATSNTAASQAQHRTRDGLPTPARTRLARIRRRPASPSRQFPSTKAAAGSGPPRQAPPPAQIAPPSDRTCVRPPATRYSARRPTRGRTGRARVFGILTGGALTAAVLLALLTPGVAAADPSVPATPPTNSPTVSPTVSPSAPGQGPDTSDCVGEAPTGEQRWCLQWIRYTPTPPQGAPSHWLTACNLTRTTDEYALCQAVALTLNTRPAAGTPSVLADVPSGTPASTDLVRCNLFTEQAAAHPDQADAWTAVHNRCVAAAPTLVQALRPPKIVGAASDACATTDQQCRIEKALKEAVAAGIRTGISGLTDFFVQAVGYMLSLLAKLVLTKTSIGAPDEAFFFSYNAAAGILIVLVFIYFIWATIINGLRVQGPSPVATLGGLVRAILGITLAGGIAWTVVSAWDEATNALIDYNASTGWDASLWLISFRLAAGQEGAGALVLIVAIFALIGLVLLFIMMLFRGLLTTGAALLGAMAMSGQVKEETRPWARTWFWTVNALAASKFFITLFWIYGTRAAYGSDDFTTMLQALLLIWLMVLCPGIMLRLLTIFDAYLSDVNSRGLVAAAAAGIGDLATRGADAAMQHLGGRNGGGDATDIMDANIAEMPTDPSQTDADADTGEGGDEDPGKGLQQMAGLEKGPVDDATKAVETGQDGGSTGDPGQAGGPAAGNAASGTGAEESGTDETTGQPHAGEAADVEGGARSARHDLGSGKLTAPGQTGDSGAVPMRPDAMAASANGNGADPTGVDPASSGSADGGQADVNQTGAAQTGGDSTDGAAGLPGGPDSVGLGPAGGPPGGSDTDGDDGHGQSSGGDTPPDPPEPGPGGGAPSGGSGPSGGPPGPAGGGGAGAAGSAEELAVVAV